tara:strand:- start:709 stop:1110 length:402 start_codon:yes stop_codon:yes gene_type:complete
MFKFSPESLFGGAVYKLKFSFDIVPPSLNISLRTHYHKRNKLFKDYYNLVFALTKDLIPPKPLEKATIKIERHYYRMLDYDNCISSYKCVVDALIHCEIIKDDNWKTIGAWKLDQIFRPKKEGPKSVIEVISE